MNKTLAGTTNNIAECLNRLSSGFKVNSAKDSPANFAIITEMQTELSSLDVARENIEQGMDVLALSEDLINNILDRLERIKQLSLAASNSIYDESSLNAIQKEIDSCVDTIYQIQTTAQYNGIDLFQTTYNLDKNLSYTLKDGSIIPSTTATSRTMSSNALNEDIAICAFSLDDNISPISINNASNTSQVIEIERFDNESFTVAGKTYTITNLTNETNTISYTYDTTNNTLTIDGGNFTLDAINNQNDNLIINGNGTIKINTGNGNDNIIINSGDNVEVNSSLGKNIITSNVSATINVGNGNNNITVNGDNS